MKGFTLFSWSRDLRNSSLYRRLVKPREFIENLLVRSPGTRYLVRYTGKSVISRVSYTGIQLYITIFSSDLSPSLSKITIMARAHSSAKLLLSKILFEINATILRIFSWNSGIILSIPAALLILSFVITLLISFIEVIPSKMLDVSIFFKLFNSFSVWFSLVF